jgi:hypothetical protein
MEALMKASWFKYLFASILVGLSAGVYQIWFHKDRSLPLSEFEQLQNQQIGNFGISELNRAARIAQKEQQFEDVDVDIPVTFEQYDDPVGYVPVAKASKTAQPYDPNAGLSIDRSSNASAFGQMPFEQPMQYPEYSPQAPYNTPSNYSPSTSSGRDHKAKPSKTNNEEPQTFSKIEHPQEDKAVDKKFDQGFSKFHPSTSVKNNVEKPKTEELKPKELPKSADMKEEPIDSSSDDGADQIPSDKSAKATSLWENLRTKFWNWWKNEKEYSDRSTARMPESKYDRFEDTLLNNNLKPDPTDNNPKPSGQKFASQEILPNSVDVDIASKPAELLTDLNQAIIDDQKNYISHDQSVRPVDIQKSTGHPSGSLLQSSEQKNIQLRNELPILNDAGLQNRARIPGQTRSVEMIEPSTIEILDPEAQSVLPSAQPTTFEIEFIEPKDVKQISSGHQQFKNKFFKGTNFQQDPRSIYMPQMMPQLERTVVPQQPEVMQEQKQTKLKIRRLTPEEEIAREMKALELSNQSDPFNPLPYENRSEADPIGQLYVIKSPSTGQEFIGTVEDIAEFLEQRPWWRKIADAFVKNREHSKDLTFEHSEGTAPEFVEPMTDEQRAEQAISQLFEGPNPSKTEDVTESIMSSSSAGPKTFSESVSRIASDVGSEAGAIAAGGSAAARLAP